MYVCMYVCTCACIYDGQAARVETQKGQLHIKHLEERIEHLQNKLKALTAPDRQREREREREREWLCVWLCVVVCVL
jgi:hypothetical protein